MKVFIITRHSINNYGSLLQSFATLFFFQSLGYDAKIINYISENECIFKVINSYAKNRNLLGIRKFVYCFLKFFDVFLSNCRFSKMRRKYLMMTRKFNSSEKMQCAFNNSLLCAGSDQLWGFMPNSEIDYAYYLNFGNDSNFFMSFSSSFGRYDFNEIELKNIKKHLEKFNLLTVRESSAVNFLRTLSIDSTEILDPTLMIDSSIYKKISGRRIIKENYIVVYKLRNDHQLELLSSLLSQKFNLKIVYISNTYFHFNKSGKTFVNPDLSLMLSLFKYSDMIISDSFHATVFSIIFEKQFYTHLPGKTNSRIVDFLNGIDLEKRFFSNINELDFNNRIDFTSINNKINKKREIYSKFLITELDKIKRMYEQNFK